MKLFLTTTVAVIALVIAATAIAGRGVTVLVAVYWVANTVLCAFNVWKTYKGEGK